MHERYVGVIVRPLYLCFAILFMFLYSVNASGEDKGVNPIQEEKALEWKGSYSKSKDPWATVIKSSAELHILGERVSADIDFSRYMVVAIFLGERMTGGYGINILRAEEVDGVELIGLPNSGVWNPRTDEFRHTESVLCGKQKVFVVEYVEVSPGRGSIVTQALTAPYDIKVVKRSDRPVVFVRYKMSKD